MPLRPVRFIGERIAVQFDEPPLLEKAPTCPSGFNWNGTPYRIIALLSEWHDFARRGRSARNMRPSHLKRAAVTGSWGVGRYYFRVRALSPQTAHSEGELFELYFDRAPLDADHRKGQWILASELTEDPE